MRHALSAVVADVGDDAKTLRTTFASELRRDLHQMTESLRVAGRRVQCRGFGNYEKMRRRLRHNVAESETQFVFVDDVGGNLAAYDFREDGFVHCVIKYSTSCCGESNALALGPVFGL